MTIHIYNEFICEEQTSAGNKITYLLKTRIYHVTSWIALNTLSAVKKGESTAECRERCFLDQSSFIERQIVQHTNEKGREASPVKLAEEILAHTTL